MHKLAVTIESNRSLRKRFPWKLTLTKNMKVSGNFRLLVVSFRIQNNSKGWTKSYKEKGKKGIILHILSEVTILLCSWRYCSNSWIWSLVHYRSTNNLLPSLVYLLIYSVIANILCRDLDCLILE